MEIDKSQVAVNGRVQLDFFGLETPILKGMLKPFNHDVEEQEIDHVQHLMINMAEQINDSDINQEFIVSIEEEDLEPLMTGLVKLSKGYLAKVAMFGFDEDTNQDIASVRDRMISKIAPGEEDSKIEIEHSFKPLDIAKDMAKDFANFDKLIRPTKR